MHVFFLVLLLVGNSVRLLGQEWGPAFFVQAQRLCHGHGTGCIGFWLRFLSQISAWQSVVAAQLSCSWCGQVDVREVQMANPADPRFRAFAGQGRRLAD